MATFTRAGAMASLFCSSAMHCNSSAIQKQRVLLCKASAASEDSSKSESSKSLFNFVTDNPSSRSAIQLPSTPAQDGNLGQMITEIESKGRDFGSYKRAGEYSWFVRETGSPDAKNGTIIFLHGAPTQSYSYRVVLEKMAEAGYHCYAPDWIGYGFSERPQPVYDFSYTEEAYHEEFDKLLKRIGVDTPFFLVTQGFIVGSYALTWALKHSDRVAKLVVLNSPLTSSAPLPGVFQQMRLPLVGEFTCQNAMLAERFVEGGSTYVLDLNDADVYRLPYLDSSDPGFALLESTRKAPLKDLTTRIETGFASGRWNVPTLVAWGVTDKYLPTSEAENFAKRNADVIQVQLLEGAGHLPQEDWPEKVVEALTKFL
ncbi:hypothetical protein GOP47_0010556 [Adiantum capillus-veneris]|uniref:AB hydrolase-1 domain-containing protein n=1 Tax=Adiantum capillus-veneris TaxID=13818 RepID=A0A9D4UUV1_ADICA|nr:hypothetical protein GOP47_0010556 [Adiantum capillus-veneris]